MLESPETAGVVVRPRLLVTPEIMQEHRVSIDLGLLQHATELYGITSESINQTPIEFTHAEVMHYYKDSVFPFAQFGSVSNVVNQYTDGSTEQFRKISVHLTSVLAISKAGYIPTLGKSVPESDAVNFNCSGTMVHELGHLAAYDKRVESAQRWQHKATRLLGRLTGTHLIRHNWDEEECEVEARTKEYLRDYPELLRMVTVDDISSN